MKIKMYQRPNGSFGVRNRIAVIPTVACVNHVVERIASLVPTADAYTHPYGCDQLGYDLELSFNCLKKMGTHPNNGAVLVLGLGCEEIIPKELYEEIKKEQPNTELLIMQENGGTDYCVDLGVKICQNLSIPTWWNSRSPGPTPCSATRSPVWAERNARTRFQPMKH